MGHCDKTDIFVCATKKLRRCATIDQAISMGAISDKITVSLLLGTCVLLLALFFLLLGTIFQY